MEDIYVNNDLTYDSYLEPDADPFVQQILASTAITSINGITGPTVTFSGGVSGFTFVPGGTTITLLSPLTAKGDLYTRNSTTGVALPVGTNTFVLSANSGTATGLEWIANATGTVTHTGALTANQLVIGNGTDDIKVLGTAGLATEVLHGNPAGAPTFSGVDLGVDVLGTLHASNGGTGQTSYAVGDLIYASASTTFSKLPDVAAGSYLRSGGVTTAPLWSTTTLPNSATTGDLLYASASNVYSNLADIATGNALISGGVTTAPSWGKVGLTTHVTGVLPVANGGVDPAAWASWTVTWTNLTVGNATVSAKYIQIGKSVLARLSIVLGNTSSVSGLVIFSLPVTSVSYAGTASVQPLGFATAYDSGSNVYVLVPVWISTTTAAFVVANTSSTYATQDAVTGTVPFTFGTSDEINCEFFYEAA